MYVQYCLADDDDDALLWREGSNDSQHLTVVRNTIDNLMLNFIIFIMQECNSL